MFPSLSQEYEALRTEHTYGFTPNKLAFACMNYMRVLCIFILLLVKGCNCDVSKFDNSTN